MSENERLLTELERDKIWENATSKTDEINRLLEAQDTKTYPLAFEAGRKEQKNIDQIYLVEQLRLQTIYATEVQAEKDRELCEYLGICQNDPQMPDYCPQRHEKSIAQAEKRGARAIMDWGKEWCTEHVKDAPKRRCLECWQAKLKSLEER